VKKDGLLWGSCAHPPRLSFFLGDMLCTLPMSQWDVTAGQEMG
jgi:hypothetical protein